MFELRVNSSLFPIFSILNFVPPFVRNNFHHRRHPLMMYNYLCYAYNFPRRRPLLVNAESQEQFPTPTQTQQGTAKLDKPMLRPQDMKVISREATMQMEANKQTCRSCTIRRIGLLRCATCKHAYYCNVDCQRSDYSKHKVECKTMARKKEELELEKQCDYTGSVETSIFLYRKKSIFSSFHWSLDWSVFLEILVRYIAHLNDGI